MRSLSLGVVAALLVLMSVLAMPATAQGPRCAEDPVGDAEPDDDRSDIDVVCVTGSGDGPYEFTLSVVEPTDPRSDEAWESEETFAAWQVDGDGDGEFDHTVVYGIEFNGELDGSVVNREEGIETCIDLPAAFDDGTFVVSDVDGACFGDPTAQIDPFGVMRYDTGDVVVADESDDAAVPDESDDATVPDESEGEGVDDSAGRVTTRLLGDSRIDTAVAVARESFPDGADTAYLARADILVDAIAGGTLTDGPVLLLPSCEDVPGIVADELERLDPDDVVALGGPVAICDETLQAAADGATARRLAGETRIGTAVQIAGESFPDTATDVYLARADEFADAVAGGSLTAGPVLVVPSCDGVPDQVAAAIDRLSPDTVTALGGTTAVCDATLDQAAAGQRTTNRLAGDTRIATAAAIGREAFGSSAASVYLARADVLADAVAGGSLTDGPVVLVPTCGDLPDVVGTLISDLDPDRVVALGGPNAVCDDILDAAGDA